mgnify:CR=1 FL=1
MMYYIKLGGILLIICVIATGILAYVNSVTEPKIIALKAAEAVKSREALIPGADFEEVKVFLWNIIKSCVNRKEYGKKT